MCVKKRIVQALLVVIVLNILYECYNIVNHNQEKLQTNCSKGESRAKLDSMLHSVNVDSITPTAENRSNDEKILIYNRVPKSGSSTLHFLTKILAKENKFQCYSSRIYFR